MRNWKPEMSSFHINKWVVLFIGIFLYLSLAYGEFKNISIAKQYIDDYKSIPNFLISLCFFYFFININLGNIKIINKIAVSAFSVYIVHQTPNLYQIIWNDMYFVTYWQKSEWLIGYCIGVSLLTYGWISIVDCLRRYLQPIITNSFIFMKFSNRMNQSYKNIPEKKI